MNDTTSITSTVAPADRVRLHSTDRCAPFCDSKDLHATDPEADDGGCWSEDFATALNTTPWVMGMPIVIDIGAYRGLGQTEATIHLTLRSTGHYDETSVKLTAEEARRISRHLAAVAELVEGMR